MGIVLLSFGELIHIVEASQILGGMGVMFCDGYVFFLWFVIFRVFGLMKATRDAEGERTALDHNALFEVFEKHSFDNYMIMSLFGSINQNRLTRAKKIVLILLF